MNETLDTGSKKDPDAWGDLTFDDSQMRPEPRIIHGEEPAAQSRPEPNPAEPAPAAGSAEPDPAPPAEQGPAASEAPAPDEAGEEPLDLHAVLEESHAKAQEAIAQAERALKNEIDKMGQALGRAQEAKDVDDIAKVAEHTTTALEHANRAQVRKETLVEEKAKLQDPAKILEMLNPKNILDLKAMYDAKVEQQKVLQQRTESFNPVDRRLGPVESAKLDELKQKAIQKYTQTGIAEGDEPRELPDYVKAEIANLMDKSYEELEDMVRNPKAAKAPKTPKPKTPTDTNLTPEPEPAAASPPQPASREKKQVEPIPDEEKIFGFNQEIQVKFENKVEKGWRTGAYDGRNRRGEPLINVSNPVDGSHMVVPQSVVKYWQELPSDETDKAHSPDPSLANPDDIPAGTFDDDPDKLVLPPADPEAGKKALEWVLTQEGIDSLKDAYYQITHGETGVYDNLNLDLSTASPELVNDTKKRLVRYFLSRSHVTNEDLKNSAFNVEEILFDALPSTPQGHYRADANPSLIPNHDLRDLDPVTPTSKSPEEQHLADEINYLKTPAAAKEFGNAFRKMLESRGENSYGIDLTTASPDVVEDIKRKLVIHGIKEGSGLSDEDIAKLPHRIINTLLVEMDQVEREFKQKDTRADDSDGTLDTPTSAEATPAAPDTDPSAQPDSKAPKQFYGLPEIFSARLRNGAVEAGWKIVIPKQNDIGVDGRPVVLATTTNEKTVAPSRTQWFTIEDLQKLNSGSNPAEATLAPQQSRESRVARGLRWLRRSPEQRQRI